MRLLLSLVLLVALSTSTALADNMACGQYIIQSGETDPETKDDIQQKCGEPTAKEGNDWIYEREGQNTKILHFNDDGGLESISERIE